MSHPYSEDPNDHIEYLCEDIEDLEAELVFTRDVIRHLVDEAKLTSSQYELCRQALHGKKPNGN